MSPHRVSSSLDCWARMIPRQLEDGVPPAAAADDNSPHACPVAATRRRSRSQHRVLYQSSSSSLSSQSQSSVVRPAKGVRFAPSTERAVYSVPSKSSYSSSERDATWYTRKDLFRIRTEAGRVVNMMRRGEYVDEYASETVTTRGLERHARESYNAERRERKSSVARAVLKEQERQLKASGCNDSDIRTASVNVSWRSMEVARAAAEWDEYVVRADYGTYEPTTTEEMPMSRVVSDDDVSDDVMEEDGQPSFSPPSSPVPEPEPIDVAVAVPPPSPRGRHKRSAAEACFQSYDVLGNEVENTPSPTTDNNYSYYEHTHTHMQQQQGYEAHYPQWHEQCYQQQGYLASQHAYAYPQQHGCHYQYYQGEQQRYYSFTEGARAKRSILCR